MKNWFVSIFLIATIPSPAPKTATGQLKANSSTENIFIITLDGFRWQEVFNGADSSLINNEHYTPGAEIIKAIYWESSQEKRREKLMPFFWNVLVSKGQLYGNRSFGNKVNVANQYAISYPGYNEMFTGNTDILISSNKKYRNPNINVLEYLNSKDEYKDKVAAFSSWDVFPFILNEKRNTIPLTSGYQNISPGNSTVLQMLNKVQEEGVNDKKATRYDQLTFIAAKEYLQQHKPRVFYLGLGETDEFAHDGRYDQYLQTANANDRMIAELWHWAQTTDGYKDNTTFIITTDHGRGRKTNKWTTHGSLVGGSSEVWLAVIGPGIEPIGEVKDNQQLYLQQLAQTIASLLGESFEPGQSVANAISLPLRKSTIDGVVLRK